MYVIQSSLTYITITLHIYHVTLYQNIHIFAYTILLFNIHKYNITYIQYIKELHNTNVFNAIKKALNHRMCYTGSAINLQCSISKLST